MKKILLSGISLIMTVSFLVGAPVTEKETDTHSLQKEKSARKNKDHSLVKSEAEILVEIEAKILEVDEDAFLDAYKDLEGSPSVIPDSQASILLNALTREEATVLLSAPRITVKNGEKATIKVGQEIPTEKVVSEAQVNSLLQQVLAKSKEEVMKILSGVDENAPLHQQLMIAFELAVTPTVQKNNQIHLQLNPKVRHFDGFIEYGGPSDPTGGIGFSKRLPSVIRMPIFSVRKTATQTTTLSNGATVIIGGLSSKKIKINDDKIPVSTESNQTRSLIMFVSAKIASTESSPERENINRLEELIAEREHIYHQTKEKEKLRTEQKLNEDHSLVKSEAEILVEIEAKILEVDEDAFLDAYKDLEGSPSVIPDSQASILLNALTREEATVLLSAPRITVKNGEKATIKVGQEIPTEKVVSEAQVNSLLQQVLAKSKEEVMKILSGVDENAPLHQQLMIAFELAVTPTVQKNNQIHLQLNPKVRHFDGFIEYGGPSDPTGGIGFSKRLPSVIRMPIFSVRKTATQTTTLSNGATVIIGGLSSKKIKINDDKIPVSTESNQTRSLIMFVSAKIASTESSPDPENIKRKLEMLKAEKKQLDEQLDKANKRLAEITDLMNQLNDESPKSSKVDIIKTNQKLNEQLNKRIFKLQHAETKDIQAILDEVIKNQQRIKQQVQGRKTGARPTAGTTAGKPAPATAAATAAQNTATGSDQAGEGSHEFSDFITISSNETSNVILVYGTKEDIVEIGRMIDSLDQPLPQETIETIYVMVDLTEQNQRGIDALLGNLEWSKFSKVEIIGIGAKLIDVNGSCTIAELIPGGPAEKSQLLEPKDVILKVSKSDGTLADISDMKLSEIVELIKGPKNSKVKLLIQPFKNPATLKEISIKRKPFHIYHQTHENKVSEKVAPVPIVDANLMGFPKEIRVGETGVEWIFNANLMGIPKKIKVGEKIFVPQEKPMTK